MLIGLLLSVAVGCGQPSDAAAGGAAPKVRSTIVVTTNLLGNVVAGLVGDDAKVVTIMPIGADPHEFQASARDAVEMRQARVLIINGAGFEQGLHGVVDAAEADGVPTYQAISAVPTLKLPGGRATDPHFFTDPQRMVLAARGVAKYLAGKVPALKSAAARERATTYIGRLEAMDREVEQRLAHIPAARRVLVTNHDVFSYFADRYHFHVVGTVIPGGTTNEGASAGDMARLADVIEAKRVPAIFADTSAPDKLAETLRNEVGGDVKVVELFSESLGPKGSGGETYIEMMETDAARISDALG